MASWVGFDLWLVGLGLRLFGVDLESFELDMGPARLGFVPTGLDSGLVEFNSLAPHSILSSHRRTFQSHITTLSSPMSHLHMPLLVLY